MATKNPDALRATLSAAADCLHTANYQTLPHEDYPGLENPADLYDAIGNLGSLHGYEPQLLLQLTGWLTRQYEAGNVAHDTGADPGPDVTVVTDNLAEAIGALSRAERYLNAAHGAAGHLKAAR